MNLKWCQYWIGLFAQQPQELIGLYSPKFLFEDVNMGIRIENDLVAMKTFQASFVVADPAKSCNRFEVFDYVGDARLGSFQWTWEARHGGDFFNVPAAGKITKTKGVTVTRRRAVRGRALHLGLLNPSVLRSSFIASSTGCSAPTNSTC